MVSTSYAANTKRLAHLFVTQDEYTHAHLCDQFKARSVRRSYVSLTCGVPSLPSGRVEIPIGRDPRDRKKMAAIPVSGGSSSGSSRSRSAASRCSVFYHGCLVHLFSDSDSPQVLNEDKRVYSRRHVDVKKLQG